MLKHVSDSTDNKPMKTSPGEWLHQKALQEYKRSRECENAAFAFSFLLKFSFNSSSNGIDFATNSNEVNKFMNEHEFTTTYFGERLTKDLR